MEQYANRKAAAQIRVVDEKGNAVKNSEFQAELTNHDFLFGCGAFDALSLMDEEKNDAFCEDRMRKWLDLYNYGTMSFYWGAYEEKENAPAYESRMNASRYLKEHGKTVKGHPLCWHTLCADWLMKYDNKTIMDRQLERIHRDVAAFAGVIDMWDVINEVVIMPEFDKYDNAVTRICREYGRITLVKEVFAAARAANPKAVLLINDFNLSDRYAKLIAECLDAGVLIDAIGLQTHQHQGYMGKEKLEEIIKRFEGFGLPLHFTENTLVSGHIMPSHIVDLNDYQIPEWPTTPEGEKRQAEEMEDMYRFLFAHPLVEAVTGWDFTDGAWLGAPSGVLRADNSKKPSYDMLQDLIHREWHTSEKIRTDENGTAVLTGFKGTYSLTGEKACGNFHLGQEKECITVTCSPWK
ncbi:MAG: 1,4-beta-xylanase [Lachnospiraceae bacterium]|nr:1,4-beta-xylanase [Lachnospiraceae bacterium]